MLETVRLSFEGPHEEPSPLVVLYNPQVLSGPLLSQVLRYGLVAGTIAKPQLSGRLKGSRAALTAMIQSYGHPVEIISAR